MFKKLIAYQRILLSSIPPFENKSLEPIKIIVPSILIGIVILLNMFILGGSTISTASLGVVALPLFSIWMISRMIHGNNRLFELVPASRKYTLLNIFILSFLIMIIGYIIFTIGIIGFFGIIIGIVYLVSPDGINQSPSENTANQVFAAKGNILMLFIVLIIIFVGVAIAFIKNEKIRIISFGTFVAAFYGLLILLKFSIPASINNQNLEFFQKFSLMPQANTILICLSILTAIICVLSVVFSYEVYVKDKCVIFNQKNV